MELSSLNCHGCGAPLEVAADARFATCSHCGARLTVKRSERAAYTELLEGIDRKTDAMAEQLSAIKRQNEQLSDIKRQNEIERIDREWEQERQQYMTTGNNGIRSEPNAIGGLIAATIAGVFGLIWTLSAENIGAGKFSLFGVLFVGLAVYVGYHSVTVGTRYMEAKARYQERRAAVVDRANESEE
ncbi:MAG TPA: hypothetical protein VGI99_14480 [Gemmataceae bacterium]